MRQKTTKIRLKNQCLRPWQCINAKKAEILFGCDGSYPYFCVPILEHMANHKATKKDVRQASKRRERNRYYGKTTRNAIRELRKSTDAAAKEEQLPLVASQIDKLAKRGVIHKNKAANLKSKLAKHVNAAKGTAA